MGASGSKEQTLRLTELRAERWKHTSQAACLTGVSVPTFGSCWKHQTWSMQVPSLCACCPLSWACSARPGLWAGCSVTLSSPLWPPHGTHCLWQVALHLAPAPSGMLCDHPHYAQVSSLTCSCPAPMPGPGTGAQVGPHWTPVIWVQGWHPSGPVEVYPWEMEDSPGQEGRSGNRSADCTLLNGLTRAHWI